VFYPCRLLGFGCRCTPSSQVHPQQTMCTPQLTMCTPTDNVEVTVDEEEKCESTNVYSGVTASSREERKLKSKKRSLGAPPEKSWLCLCLKIGRANRVGALTAAINCLDPPLGRPVFPRKSVPSNYPGSSLSE
jgi:hypothetical protein